MLGGREGCPGEAEEARPAMPIAAKLEAPSMLESGAATRERH